MNNLIVIIHYSMFQRACSYSDFQLNLNAIEVLQDVIVWQLLQCMKDSF